MAYRKAGEKQTAQHSQTHTKLSQAGLLLAGGIGAGRDGRQQVHAQTTCWMVLRQFTLHAEH